MHYSKLDHHVYQKYRMPKNVKTKAASVLNSQPQTKVFDRGDKLSNIIQKYLSIEHERIIWLVLSVSISIGLIVLGTLIFNHVPPLSFTGKVLSIFIGLALFTLIGVKYQQRKKFYQLTLLSEVRKHDRNLLNDIEFRISNRLYNI